MWIGYALNFGNPQGLFLLWVFAIKGISMTDINGMQRGNTHYAFHQNKSENCTAAK